MMVVVTAATAASANVNDSSNAAFGNDAAALPSTASTLPGDTGRHNGSSSKSSNTASGASAANVPEIVDVPASTPHVLLSSGDRGEQSYQVNRNRFLTQPWTYVLRFTLSTEQSSSTVEASPLSPLSSVVTSEQWNELWSQRLLPIKEDLLQLEQVHRNYCDLAWYLIVIPSWLFIVFGFWWSPSVLNTFNLACFSTAWLLHWWSYKRTVPHRMRAWQSFCKVCDDMNTAWLSLHQHGWTAECYYEQWYSATRGCRLYFLPIQPQGLSLSTKSDQNQSNEVNRAKATEPLPMLLSTLDQNGSVCFLLSKPQSTTDSWLTWTPLAQNDNQKAMSNSLFATCDTMNANTKTAALVTGEDMETPIFIAADVGRLLRRDEANVTLVSGRGTNDTGITIANTDMADVWSRFWLDWQLAAARYNKAHRVVLVMTIALVAPIFLQIGVIATEPYFAVTLLISKRTVVFLYLGFLATMVLWIMAQCRKHASFCNLEEVVEQHCFDFIDDNIFMEFRTVATSDDWRRRRHGKGRAGCCGGVFGTSQSIEFAHYLYWYRIPPKLSPTQPSSHTATMEYERPVQNMHHD